MPIIVEVFGPETADTIRRGRGRPVKPDRKINQTLRLDPDVLEACRQLGLGWQTRMNAVLRRHMPKTPSGAKTGDKAAPRTTRRAP